MEDNKNSKKSEDSESQKLKRGADNVNKQDQGSDRQRTHSDMCDRSVLDISEMHPVDFRLRNGTIEQDTVKDQITKTEFQYYSSPDETQSYYLERIKIAESESPKIEWLFQKWQLDEKFKQDAVIARAFLDKIKKYKAKGGPTAFYIYIAQILDLTIDINNILRLRGFSDELLENLSVEERKILFKSILRKS